MTNLLKIAKMVEFGLGILATRAIIVVFVYATPINHTMTTPMADHVLSAHAHKLLYRALTLLFEEESEDETEGWFTIRRKA